jgi:hypothetical protein
MCLTIRDLDGSIQVATISRGEAGKLNLVADPGRAGSHKGFAVYLLHYPYSYTDKKRNLIHNIYFRSLVHSACGLLERWPLIQNVCRPGVVSIV